MIGAMLAVLDRFEVPYCIGGSVASSAYGLSRQTNDVDMLADFRAINLSEFCDFLVSEGFYIDSETAISAARDGRMFNAIHKRTLLKFDFYPLRDGDGFAESELRRRRYVESNVPGLDGVEFAVVSPEDAILAKLVWFRKGGETSDRQWYDVTGIVQTRRASLDLNYLREWAARLGVTDILDKLLAV